MKMYVKFIKGWIITRYEFAKDDYAIYMIRIRKEVNQ